MHRSLLLGYCILFATGSAVAVETSSALTVSGCDFGDVYSTRPASCTLSFSNNDNHAIKISNFRIVAQQGSALPNELEIAPGTTGHVRISVDTSKSAGRNSYVVLFDSSPKAAYRSAKIRGFVRTSLAEAAPVVNLGVVDVGASSEPLVREVRLSSKEVAGFRIERVIASPDWLAATVLDDGGLKLSVKERATWGLQDDYLRVAMNTPNQPEAMIRVKADVHGKVVPSENPLDLGIMRLGNKNEALVRLNDLTGKPLNLGAMKIKGILGEAKELTCQPKQPSCKMVKLRISEKQATGSLKGELLINLPDYQRDLLVNTWGVLIPKDYKIPSLNEKMAAAERAEKKDLAGQLKVATSEKKQLELPEPPGKGPLLKWVVSDAGTVYGFEIFRSDSEAGPYLLINPELVHAETENDEQQAFQWRDTTAKPGTTYYYSIGIVRVNGKKEPLIEKQKVVVH